MVTRIDKSNKTKGRMNLGT